MALPVETFFLSPNHQGTLQSQVQQMIAHGILSGGLQLPSPTPNL
jgi:GntR family transcriptional regulator/MocR family aminotransferase